MRNSGQATRKGGRLTPRENRYLSLPGALGVAHWGTDLDADRRAALRGEYRDARDPSIQRLDRQKTFTQIVRSTDRDYNYRQFGVPRMYRRHPADHEQVPKVLTSRTGTEYYNY